VCELERGESNCGEYGGDGPLPVCFNRANDVAVHPLESDTGDGGVTDEINEGPYEAAKCDETIQHEELDAQESYTFGSDAVYSPAIYSPNDENYAERDEDALSTTELRRFGSWGRRGGFGLCYERIIGLESAPELEGGVGAKVDGDGSDGGDKEVGCYLCIKRGGPGGIGYLQYAAAGVLKHCGAVSK